MPTYVFQVRFPPRKHGVRGNECQKRSVVSVWYAQNSLPFCTEVWYTTLMSCEDPTKMLIRVCILLPMQPAPLTGTATSTPALPDWPVLVMQPAPLTGTATGRSLKETLHLVSDAARAPHGDSNSYFAVTRRPSAVMMQPAPLTGTATAEHLPILCSAGDAARTPRGDSNFTARHEGVYGGMQPAPLTGTATKIFLVQLAFCHLDAARTPHGDEKRETRNSSVSCLPFLYKRLFPHLVLPYRWRRARGNPLSQPLCGGLPLRPSWAAAARLHTAILLVMRQVAFIL